MFTGCSGGKEEVRSVEDLVVETTGDQKKGRYRSKGCMSIICAKQLLLDYNIYTLMKTACLSKRWMLGY